MKTLVIANSKGGSGKTTTSFNLAHNLANEGKSVLLIDFDPQASLTACFKVELPQNQVYIEDLISKQGYGRLHVREAIVSPKEDLPSLYLIPASGSLANLEGELKGPAGLVKLRELIKGLNGLSIDVVIIDPPGSTDVFMSLALMAAEDVVIPAKPTDTDIRTLKDFIPFVEEHKTLNTNLNIRGILINQAQTASKNADFYLDQLNEAGLGSLILKPQVRLAIDAANSIAYGKSATEYKSKSPVSKDFINLSKEVLKWL